MTQDRLEGRAPMGAAGDRFGKRIAARRRAPAVAAAWIGALACWWTPGCAMLLNGAEQQVRITSVPPGARVTVDGRTARTPAVLRLRRDRDYRVTAELEGFAPAHGRIRHRADPRVTVGDWLLLGLPLLWESDHPGRYRLEPPELDLTLSPEGWSPR